MSVLISALQVHLGLVQASWNAKQNEIWGFQSSSVRFDNETTVEAEGNIMIVTSKCVTDSPLNYSK